MLSGRQAAWSSLNLAFSFLISPSLFFSLAPVSQCAFYSAVYIFTFKTSVPGRGKSIFFVLLLLGHFIFICRSRNVHKHTALPFNLGGVFWTANTGKNIYEKRTTAHARLCKQWVLFQPYSSIFLLCWFSGSPHSVQVINAHGDLMYTLICFIRTWVLLNKVQGPLRSTSYLTQWTTLEYDLTYPMVPSE